VLIVVIGAGIFGVTCALELRARGHHVTLVDAGPVPHPLAESTDISKIVRLEYGADADYVALAERALDGWRRWNRGPGAPLFHETGVLFVGRAPLAPGGFEHDSLALLSARGHRLERLGAAELAARFPAWNTARYVDGIFDPAGGWVESGAVVARLAAEARATGVELVEGRPIAGLAWRGGRVAGVVAEDGGELPADLVVAATGAWIARLIPESAAWLRPNGMPVFHLAPDDPAAFAADRFPVFGADITATGYYGFPLHPGAGVVKVANHGDGRRLDPSASRAVTEAEIADLYAFLEDALPELRRARLVASRICVYCDTWDGHFWIAPDPERPGLVVATGGSGHAFKFAPVLGALVADIALGAATPLAAKFRWRPELGPRPSEEAARRK
jgi:glycine/D-amino acid oxidase-like deaminating enzyme